MANKKIKKPVLIKVGENLVDPNDVTAICKAGKQKKLYVIRLKSQPNPEFPLWALESELGALLEQFEIVESDGCE